MSIKSWFGRNLYKMLQETQREQEADVKAVQDMERVFGSASPCVVAFRINNGFVVRTMNQEDAYVGIRTGGFTYCKDHAEIAEHIVASEVKRKLNIGEDYQQEMFAAEKARAVAMQGGLAQAKRATNRI